MRRMDRTRMRIRSEKQKTKETTAKTKSGKSAKILFVTNKQADVVSGRLRTEKNKDTISDQGK